MFTYLEKLIVGIRWPHKDVDYVNKLYRQKPVCQLNLFRALRVARFSLNLANTLSFVIGQQADE